MGRGLRHLRFCSDLAAKGQSFYGRFGSAAKAA